MSGMHNVSKEAEKQAYEKMCKAYDDGNYNMAQEYLEQVESIEEYSRGEEIQSTLEVWGQLEKIHEKIMNIKPGILKRMILVITATFTRKI